MGKWRDFFKALVTNDTADDDKIYEDLNKFISDNSDSARRVAAFERQLEESHEKSKSTIERTSTITSKKQTSRKKAPETHRDIDDKER